jgi:PAS domain S-box-containing protein
MSLAGSGLSKGGPSLLVRLGILVAQARVALGRGGTAWLGAAALLGMMCCAVSLVDVALTLTLDGTDVASHQEKAAAIRGLEKTHRDLMRTIVTQSTGALTAPRGEKPASDAWTRFATLLENVCSDRELLTAYGASFLPLCQGRGDLMRRLGPEVEAFDPPRRLLDKSAIREITDLRDALEDLAAMVARQNDDLALRMTHDARKAMMVLGISTAGFMVAGLILLLLVGRISLLQSEQSEKAGQAAALLRETLETLPAGVVVYDRDERLLMFNSTAAEFMPGLREPDVVGRTYEELAQAAAARLEAAGLGTQPVEEWIERFRTKTTHRTRQAENGRWFEWMEKATPGGLTVGLRVDVSEIKNQELELEQARTKYQQLVDSLSDMVYSLDGAGRFTYASPTASALLGVPASTVVGTLFRNWVVPEDLAKVMAAGEAYYRSPNQEMRQIQLRMKAVDGAVRTVEVRYRKIVGGSEQTAQVGLIRDVTERVALERQLDDRLVELARARAEYQSLVDSLSDVAYTLDIEKGVYTFISAAGEKFFGKPASEIIGRHFIEFIAPVSQEEVRRMTLRDYRPDDPGTSSRFCLIAAGGEIRHVEVRARRRFDENGRLLSSGVIRDVEERVRLEKRLEQETNRLRSIVESSGALIVLVDTDLNIVMANSGFSSLTGVSAANAVGRPLREVMDCPLGGIAGEPEQFAVRLRDPAGGQRLIAITATPVAGVDGRIDSIVLLGVDDTQRRHAEQALYDTERFATVGEMAGTMAHEISQPLQVINIACASAREELSDAALQGGAPDAGFLASKLGRIAQQVDSASRIVHDLRAFVRGSGQSRSSPFDPAHAVSSAVDVTVYGVRQAGATLSISLSPGLPSVVGDVGRLEQVLVNLINNARDAGGRTIRIVADATGDRGNAMVRIAVEDSGPGIAPEILPQLFVSFVSTKPRGKGTGLGLRICRRIVEEMGGSISASNRPDGGARFELLLPATIPRPARA